MITTYVGDVLPDDPTGDYSTDYQADPPRSVQVSGVIRLNESEAAPEPLAPYADEVLQDYQYEPARFVFVGAPVLNESEQVLTRDRRYYYADERLPDEEYQYRLPHLAPYYGEVLQDSLWQGNVTGEWEYYVDRTGPEAVLRRRLIPLDRRGLRLDGAGRPGWSDIQGAAGTILDATTVPIDLVAQHPLTRYPVAAYDFLSSVPNPRNFWDEPVEVVPERPNTTVPVSLAGTVPVVGTGLYAVADSRDGYTPGELAWIGASAAGDAFLAGSALRGARGLRGARHWWQSDPGTPGAGPSRTRGGGPPGPAEQLRLRPGPTGPNRADYLSRRVFAEAQYTARTGTAAPQSGFSPMTAQLSPGGVAVVQRTSTLPAVSIRPAAAVESVPVRPATGAAPAVFEEALTSAQAARSPGAGPRWIRTPSGLVVPAGAAAHPNATPIGDPMGAADPTIAGIHGEALQAGGVVSQPGQGAITPGLARSVRGLEAVSTSTDGVTPRPVTATETRLGVRGIADEDLPHTTAGAQPVTGTATEPGFSILTEPFTEPIVEPETIPTTEPEAIPTTEPEAIPTTEPETIPTTEPGTGPITEPITQPEPTPAKPPGPTRTRPGDPPVPRIPTGRPPRLRTERETPAGRYPGKVQWEGRTLHTLDVHGQDAGTISSEPLDDAHVGTFRVVEYEATPPQSAMHEAPTLDVVTRGRKVSARSARRRRRIRPRSARISYSRRSAPR